MHTLVLNVENETVLSKLMAFIATLKDGISVEKDIELLSPEDSDFKLITEAKQLNESSYSIEDTKRLLGL